MNARPKSKGWDITDVVMVPLQIVGIFATMTLLHRFTSLPWWAGVLLGMLLGMPLCWIVCGLSFYLLDLLGIGRKRK
ncbi:hypothetical protein CfE428DRAFT_1891 [Chthoniobacter flavus Ellin428]|uniref:Uncharacterized protein n=1 Tax=Chthoniobacter flavus Ellin428 TaxID=497964 RepID=B4CZ03_9BACT|nr:hypothetical protein [Chthoniobacter flavus]EDY20694.1 hypothetical protein CfE428DRAFT_1891 [Chthoniobacter flavus Ellin428]TCO89592.1 hypothetical protein EV701_11328 [Chthoniobacter flavus]